MVEMTFFFYRVRNNICTLTVGQTCAQCMYVQSGHPLIQHVSWSNIICCASVVKFSCNRWVNIVHFGIHTTMVLRSSNDYMRNIY